MKLVSEVFFTKLTVFVNSGFFYLKRVTVQEMKASCQEFYLQNQRHIDALINTDFVLLEQIKILECQTQRWLHPIVAAYVFLLLRKLNEKSIELIFETETKAFCYLVNQFGWQLLTNIHDVNVTMENKLITIVCTKNEPTKELLDDELLTRCINKTSGKINFNFRTLLKRFLLNELDEEFFLSFVDHYLHQKELLIKMLVFRHEYLGIALIHVAALYFSEASLVQLLTAIGPNVRCLLARTSSRKTVLDLLCIRDMNRGSNLLASFSDTLSSDFFDVVFEKLKFSKLFLHQVAKYSFLPIVSLVFAKTSATHIAQALLSQDKNGDTPLHHIAEKNKDVFWFENIIMHLVSLGFSESIGRSFAIRNQSGQASLDIVGRKNLKQQCSTQFKMLFFAASKKRKCEGGEDAPPSKRIKRNDSIEDEQSEELSTDRVAVSPSNKL